MALELRLGRHHEVMGDLTTLVEEHPLRDLQHAILTGALDAPPAPRPDRARPRQLLPDITDFTGWEDLADRLETLLRTAGTATAVVVTAVAGQAGVGKTACSRRTSPTACPNRSPTGSCTWT